MNAMLSRGLAAKTTAAFSKYRTDFVTLNNSIQRDLRNDDEKLTANYMSALERCGLEDKLGNDMLQFYVMHPGSIMTNARKIECIRNVLSTADAKANADAGTNASALIVGSRQVDTNALAAPAEDKA